MKGARALFVATILAGSFLLFLVQPMIARIALPRLGGAPAVWNSAMLVYQALLLGGYAYAHALSRLAPRRQGAVHVAVLLLACAFLPIGLSDKVLPAGAEPAVWVPYLFALSIGPLFFAVSAQAPLMQRWFSLARPGGDPYPLYAASNLGSFAGLLAYPLLVEPLLTVPQQRWLWSGGYVALIVLVACCVVALPRPATGVAPPVRPDVPPPAPVRIALWIVLALVPSGMMLATSTFISTDIVAMPLLWVIPLSLYLLSFSVAFAGARGPADALTRFAPITIVMFGGIMMGGFTEAPWLSATVALILLFMISVALHTRLYRLRPAPDRLTGFYLATSVGGALGGVFAALVAPVVFDWTWEYPILILAAGLLAPQRYAVEWLRTIWERPGARIAALLVAILAMTALLLVTRYDEGLFTDGRFAGAAFLVVAVLGVVSMGARLPYMLTLTVALLLFGGLRSVTLSLEPGARLRSYFGVYLVAAAPGQRMLAHGTTVHGIQLTGSDARERALTTYYVPGSGVGRIMAAAPDLFGNAARIGVVGLGTGTLACYRRPGQRWRFYEIDPAMVRIARGHPFTFLNRCAPDATIDIGDARLSLEREGSATLDVLALDAFSSDAVPMHLLTDEAFATYARVLQPRGILAVHVSNRYLDLLPVAAAAARTGGWHAAVLNYTPSAGEAHASRSQWVALTRDPAAFAYLQIDDPSWRMLRGRRGFAAWTDDYATILPLLKW